MEYYEERNRQGGQKEQMTALSPLEIMLRERGQTQKDAFCMIPFM